MKDSFVISALIHGIVAVGITGCAIHRPVTQVDPLIREAQEYVSAVSSKMPLWDDDTHYAIYERGAIATVKADIEVAKLANSEAGFLKDVSKLHTDCEQLLALDELLRHTSLT